MSNKLTSEAAAAQRREVELRREIAELEAALESARYEQERVWDDLDDAQYTAKAATQKAIQALQSRDMADDDLAYARQQNAALVAQVDELMNERFAVTDLMKHMSGALGFRMVPGPLDETMRTVCQDLFEIATMAKNIHQGPVAQALTELLTMVSNLAANAFNVSTDHEALEVQQEYRDTREALARAYGVEVLPPPADPWSPGEPASIVGADDSGWVNDEW